MRLLDLGVQAVISTLGGFNRSKIHRGAVSGPRVNCKRLLSSLQSKSEPSSDSLTLLTTLKLSRTLVQR